MEAIEEAPKRNRYQINTHHYEKELKKTRRIALQQTVRDGLLNQFNFKKTNAFKGVWSCSGYGGKCPRCKGSSFGLGKKYRKEYYSFGEDSYFRIIKCQEN